LDEKILTLPEPVTPQRYSSVVYDYGQQSRTAPLSAWSFNLDEALEGMPTYTEVPPVDLMIEWVYAIDLDHEIVQIKSSWAEMSLRLISGPQLLQEFERQEEDRDDEDDEDGVDQESVEHTKAIAEEKMDDQKCEESAAIWLNHHRFVALLNSNPPSAPCISRYDTLKVTKVKPRSLHSSNSQADFDSRAMHSYVVRVALFNSFIRSWTQRLSKHILICRPVDFIYREVVFAILSLASGEFKLLANQSPRSKSSDRLAELKVPLGSPNGSGILPHFGSGMHYQNILPGSAPETSIYWFKGVLILLVDIFVDDNGIKAAIGTATELGRDSGHKIFDALITNIRTFVLVRIEESGVVQHTDPIKLLNFTTFCQRGEDEGFIPVEGNTTGFGMLMEFFNVVAAYNLKPFRPVAKILPNELYHRIIDMVDFDTYPKCLDVSDAFRHHVQNNTRLSQQPNFPTGPHQDGEFTHHLIKGFSPADSEFVIFDCVEGRHVKSGSERVKGGVGDAEWVPVIGDDKRQSIMVGCEFTVLELAPHPLPRAKESRSELDAPETCSPTRFCIPKYVGVRDVSSAWSAYVRWSLLIERSTGEPLRSWSCHPELLLRHMPSNTANLELKRHLNKSFKTCLIWLRKSTDFELPPVRQRVLGEAQDYLRGRGRADGSLVNRLEREGFLVIAFGTKAQCFQWSQLSDKPNGIRPVTTFLGDGAVLDVSHEEERKRFEELFWRWEAQGDKLEATESSPVGGE
jgi:hypothetical protein